MAENEKSALPEYGGALLKCRPAGDHFCFAALYNADVR